MNKLKIPVITFAILALIVGGCNRSILKDNTKANTKVIVAYVTSGAKSLPDPFCMTHINYAFGHVNKDFNGIDIDNEEQLKKIVALKTKNPKLKVLLSVGGWESGRFSEMAADNNHRLAFAKDCKRIVGQYGLDGIDIDWEYPTSSAAGISCSPEDTENYTKLMQDIRKKIGKKKLLTLASAASAQYIDFQKILPCIDFVNIMSYDMATAPKHHSALYSSGNSGAMTAEKAVQAHLKAGIPPSMLTLGMPFYGRGGGEYPNSQSFRDIPQTEKYVEKWDDTAKVPYLVNKDGTFVFGFENARSLAIKCRYIREQNLLGGMYWEYGGDNEQGELRHTVYNNLQ